MLMFIVLSSWQSHCESSSSLFDECRTETSGRRPHLSASVSSDLKALYKSVITIIIIGEIHKRTAVDFVECGTR